jgi:hypothetical protein
MSTGSFPGIKPVRRGVDHEAHLVTRLKEEQSYTSPPPFSLPGLFWDELYL